MALKGSRAMETLAPGERTARKTERNYMRQKKRGKKGERERGGRESKRENEEETKKGLAIAPTLGKFGVTQGDEDKSRLWTRVGAGRNEGKRGSKRGGDHRPQGWTGDR